MSTLFGIPAISVRWTVDNQNTHNPSYSPSFEFQNVEWRLIYNLSKTKRHCLVLERTSGQCCTPFSVAVHLQSCCGEGSLLRLMAQRERVVKADYIRIWERPDENIPNPVVGKNRQKLELRFLVILKTDGLCTETTSYCTFCFTERTLSARASQNEYTSTNPSQPLWCTDSCFDSLSEDFAKLLDEGSSPDVEFECGGQTMGAHRLIICARSPVIASMMGSDMVEGRTGKVKISDMEPDVFRHFLRYMYSGQLPELTVDLALCLYESADQYEVQGLAKRCSDFLVGHLTVQNACRVLAVADAHSAKGFKEAVVRFVLQEQIPLSGQHWRDFCHDHSDLANEVLNRFCEKLSDALKASQAK